MRTSKRSRLLEIKAQVSSVQRSAGLTWRAVDYKQSNCNGLIAGRKSGERCQGLLFV